MNTKVCACCKIEKLKSDFYLKGDKRKKPDAVMYICKKCHNRKIDERRKHKPHVIIKKNLSKRCRAALQKFNIKKDFATSDISGCSLQELKNHLENLFQPGMSWENYGNPNGDHTDCWHIDHIIPCASFDLTDPEQQKKCFHYTNLQPMWGKDNIKKGAKLA